MERNASDFSTLITTNSIIVNYDGKSKTVVRADSNYEPLLLCLREGRWDDVEKLLSPDVVVSTLSNGEMRVEDGQVYVKGVTEEFPVPSGLNETILRYIEQKIPFQPLVKFAYNLSQNPSFNSVHQLFSFLDKNQFTITESGNFIAYKSIRSDFKDVYTGTFDNSVGQVVKMDRADVNENPAETCSRGLHVANYDYAHNIYRGAVTVVVEVNPMNVVSVPVDYNNAKMRVSEYKVLRVSDGEIKRDIYEMEEIPYSDYEKWQDEEACTECGELDCSEEECIDDLA